MCQAKPGVRCAADTRGVADATARAYHEMFGPDAPAIDPETSALELMAAPIGDEQAASQESYRGEVRRLARQNVEADPAEFQKIAQVWRAEQIVAAGGHNPLPLPEPVACGTGDALAKGATIEFVPGEGWRAKADFIRGGYHDDSQEIVSGWTRVLPTREAAEEYLSTLTKCGPGEPGPNARHHNLVAYPHRTELGGDLKRLHERAAEARVREATFNAQVRSGEGDVALAMTARGEACAVAIELERRADTLDARLQAWEAHTITLGIANPAEAWRRSGELRGQIAKERDPFKRDALITEHNVLVPACDRLRHEVPPPSLWVAV